MVEMFDTVIQTISAAIHFFGNLGHYMIASAIIGQDIEFTRIPKPGCRQ
jgi:hypothetical protein